MSPAQPEQLAAAQAEPVDDVEGDARLLDPGASLVVVPLGGELGERGTHAGDLSRRKDPPAAAGLARPVDELDRVLAEQAALARASRIEAGARRPSLGALRKLAAELDVTALYLETGSDDVVCPHCGRPKP